MEPEGYPTIVLWKDREVPLSWYEFVFQPQKLKGHLKILTEQPDKEPTFCQIISSFLEKSGRLESQGTNGEIQAASSTTEGAPTNPASPRANQASGLLCYALFVASYLRWSLPLLEKGLSPPVIYSLLKALKELNGSDDVPSLCLYYHWVLRYYHQYDLPMRPGRSNSELASAGSNEKFAALISEEVPEAKRFLRDKCGSDSPLLLPVVLVPGDAVQVDFNTIRGSKFLNVGQVWLDLGLSCLKDEEFEDALTAFNNSMSHPQPCAGQPHAYSRSDVTGYAAACRSVLGEDHQDSAPRMPLHTDLGRRLALPKARKFLREKNFQALVPLLLNDIIAGEIPEWFREEIVTALLKEEHSQISEDSAGEPSSKRRKTEKKKEEKRRGFDGTVKHKILACETLYNLTQGNPHCCRWQHIFQDASKETILTVAKLLVEWRETMEDSNSDNFNPQSVYCFVRLVASQLGKHSQRLYQKLVELFDLQDTSMENDSTMPPLLEAPPPVKTEIQVLLAQGTATYLQSSEGRALRRISMEKELLASKSPLAVVTLVGRLYELLPLDQVEAYALKYDSSGPGFAPPPLITDPVLRTKYNIVISKVNKLQAVNTQIDYRKCVEFYRAAVKLLEGQSSSVKSSRIPHLQERILTMELGHACCTWNDAHTSKFPLLIEKAKAFLKQSQSAAEFSPSSIQAACSFLLNAKEYKFLSSLEHLCRPGKVAPRLAAILRTQQDKGHMRKPTRDLFDAVLGVFASSEGTALSELREIRSSFELFVNKLRNEDCISFLLSALGRLWNMVKHSSMEINLQHSSHWPTAMGSPNVNADLVYRSMVLILNQAVKHFPKRGEWSIISGDLQFVRGGFSTALQLYLEAGSISSDHFCRDVPSSVWSAATFRSMLSCCTELHLPVHALILCQYMDPIPYTLAFSLIKSSSNDNVDLLSECIWDMTLIEHLIYTYNKDGDTFRRSHMVRLAGEPQLNINNSTDILLRAQQVRRKRFFSELFRLTHTL